MANLKLIKLNGLHHGKSYINPGLIIVNVLFQFTLSSVISERFTVTFTVLVPTSMMKLLTKAYVKVGEI